MCGSDHAFAGSRPCRSVRSFEALFAGKKVKDLRSWVRMDLPRYLGFHLGAEIGFVHVQHITCCRRDVRNGANLRDECPSGRAYPLGSKREQPDLSAHSTTELAEVAGSCAAFVVEKFSRRRNRTPFGSV